MVRFMIKRQTAKKRRRGGTTLLGIGVAGVILLFGLFFLEMQQLFDYQYAIEVRAQRAVNSLVEFAMDDRYRADGFNVMDVSKAQANLKKYLDEDLNVDAAGYCRDASGKVLYKVTYHTATYTSGKVAGQPAGVKLDITVNMKAGLGKAFGIDGYTWTNTFSSINFRTDNDERAGNWADLR